MADAEAVGHEEADNRLTYREQSVDKTLEDHEKRITDNERRWLVTKGALIMLAAIKGVDFGISQLASLI